MYFPAYSGSSDGTLQVVDMRANSYKQAQLRIQAHKKDVNVCDWNKKATHLLVTGSDDCTVKVWDLRMIS
jgi:WD40 repeat protein